MKETNQRVVWLDVVRFFAMFMVVCCHSADPFNFYVGEEPANIGEIQFWGAAWGSFLRPCVPLFVMITGALLLPVRQESSVFYKRRIGRVFWPFLLWSILYNLFPWALGLLGYAPDFILNFFPYSGEAATAQSLSSSAGHIARIATNFSPLDVHMWYIYLLIGLYLYLPVFSAWVEKASRKAQAYFLLAWGVTTLLPYYKEYVDPYLWGTCSWNEFGMLYYFAGFNGYLLLGHYLSKTDWSLSKTLGLGLPMLAAGFFVTFFGFRHTTSLPDCTPELLELFFTYNSLNVVLMTTACFMLFKKITVTNPLVQALLKNLTACGFGVYMVHFFFTGPCINLMRLLDVPVCVQIPLGAVVAFSVSWTLVYVLRLLFGSKSAYVVG